MNTNTRGRMTAIAAAVLAGAAAVAITGCRGGREEKPPRQFFPDLDDQKKWKPQEQNEFFADGRTMRKPVAHTVPFARVSFAASEQMAESGKPWASHWADERTDLLKADDAFYTGKGGDAFLAKIPVAVTRPMLELGKKKFNIYCSVCHGYLGDGQGMVGRSWSAPLPSFHDPKYLPGATEDVVDEATKQSRKQIAKTGLDGYLFNIARNGLPDDAKPGEYRMPAYGHALSERDTWAVIAYIRALQEARGASLSDPGIPEAQREALAKSKPAPAPAATPAAGASTPPAGGQK
ncbi:MAG: cytochrome c [Phycisphaerales bacterium]|nr:cytochrome c [Phycisphaerales bacterium]